MLVLLGLTAFAGAGLLWRPGSPLADWQAAIDDAREAVADAEGDPEVAATDRAEAWEALAVALTAPPPGAPELSGPLQPEADNATQRARMLRDLAARAAGRRDALRG